MKLEVGDIIECDFSDFKGTAMIFKIYPIKIKSKIDVMVFPIKIFDHGGPFTKKDFFQIVDCFRGQITYKNSPVKKIRSARKIELRLIKLINESLN